MTFDEGIVAIREHGFSHITKTATGYYYAEPGEMCYATRDPGMSPLLENTP